MKIYVVNGSTGEYSDYCDWDVKAFTNKDDADDLCKKLNDWCQQNGVSERYNRKQLKCPFDPFFSSNYTGTSYCVFELELEGVA